LNRRRQGAEIFRRASRSVAVVLRRASVARRRSRRGKLAAGAHGIGEREAPRARPLLAAGGAARGSWTAVVGGRAAAAVAAPREEASGAARSRLGGVSGLLNRGGGGGVLAAAGGEGVGEREGEGQGPVGRPPS